MALEPKDFPGFIDAEVFEFQADRVLLYVQEYLRDFPGIAHNAKIDLIRTPTIESIVARLMTWCVSGRIEDLVHTHTIRYPDGVWQMFKELHTPDWFKRKFPVRKKEVVVKEYVNHYFVCPHLVTDPQQQHIRFMATGTRLAGRMHG